MKEIIINYNNQKKDILVLDDGKIVEQYQEFDNSRSLEGNIYLGKVVDVLLFCTLKMCYLKQVMLLEIKMRS